VNLIYRRASEQKKNDMIIRYPDISTFINRLELSIKKEPSGGRIERLTINGKIVPTHRRSLKLSLFSHNYSIGYDNITANYIVCEDQITILYLYFT
jgi:hypothetical protein